METVDLQPKEVEPHLWSLVTCMVSSLELATRPVHLPILALTTPPILTLTLFLAAGPSIKLVE